MDLVTFQYTNHRGKTTIRRVRPIRVFYGSTAWHPEAQWLLEAFDIDKLVTRDFAMSGIVAWKMIGEAELTHNMNQQIPQHFGIIGGPYPFVCPCGQPLSLYHRVDGGTEQWLIGHLEKTCSPLILASSVEEAMRVLGQMLITRGHFQTAKEYIEKGATDAKSATP